MLRSNALSLMVLGLMATLTVGYAVPDTTSPTNNTILSSFGSFRVPVSGTVMAYLRLAQSLPSNLPAESSQTSLATGSLTDPTIIFNNDPNPLPQNEETIATSPTASGTVVGGYNDFRGLLALLNPAVPDGFSGFSISNDGGASVRTDGDLPKLLLPLTNSPTLSQGDPAIDVSNAGTFYYSSLYYNFSTSKFPACPKKAPCESAVAVFPSVQSNFLSSCQGPACWGQPKIVADTTFTQNPAGGIFNDKDWIAIDRTPQSSGIYVSYTAFNLQPFSTTINLVRCSLDLSTCSAPSVISGTDSLTQGSFVAVRTDGSVAIVYVSYDVSPLRIRGVQCTPGTGVAFTCSAPNTIATINTQLFLLTTENIFIATLPQMAVDYSNVHPNRVVIVWHECATHYVQGATFQILVCPQGFVRTAFTDANSMTGPWTTLNVTSNGFFPTVSIDSTKGTVNIAYYSTINDVPWNHRLDFFVTQYASGALTGAPTVVRITATSDEPDNDPDLRGFFFGDYVQATASAGILYVSYTANYAQKGSPPTFQQDNYLTTIPD